MISLSLGILAALAWGLHDLAARIIATKATAFAIMFGTIGTGFLILTPFALIFSDWKMLSEIGIYWAIGSGIAYVMGGYGLFRAFSMAPAWLVSPIASSYPLIYLIFSFYAAKSVSHL
ncbi:MAG: drug/metabolite transporter (DMT)-like permease [Paracoccaceae bacterium]|jgi:drug/metabolite transporter (DMT)-like permease